MKTKLFAAALLTLSLIACGKKEETVALPPPANQPSLSAPVQETPAPNAAPAATTGEAAPAATTAPAQEAPAK